MPFRQSALQKNTEQALFGALAKRLHKAHEEPAKRAREDCPVDTGALRDSIRIEDPIHEGDRIIGAISAGSDVIDYAFKIEVLYKPFLRPNLPQVWDEFKRSWAAL